MAPSPAPAPAPAPPPKIKPYSWLNPTGTLFESSSPEKKNYAPKPPPPFEVNDIEYVPVTKSFGSKPNSSNNPRKQMYEHYLYL